MSLYGLDLIEVDGKNILLEINGINSGMNGFKEIYGDERVKDKVMHMLEDKYGKLTANFGRYTYEKFKREHLFRFLFRRLGNKIPLLSKKYYDICKLYGLEKSEKAFVNALISMKKRDNGRENEHEEYMGQESTILNYHNEILPHPNVNSYVAQAITKNKLLQYMLLKDSILKSALIPTTMVGLGTTDEECLDEFLQDYQEFMLKPVLGMCGIGINGITKSELANDYKNSRGPIREALPFQKKNCRYVEDMIDQKNFIFEPFVSVLQPFTGLKEEDGYSSIRAIVCNGRFVDAYVRKGPNPVVNISGQGVTAHSLDYDSGLVDFCEYLIQVYESEANRYTADNFKKELYGQYFAQRGQTTEEMREWDRKKATLTSVLSMCMR